MKGVERAALFASPSSCISNLNLPGASSGAKPVELAWAFAHLLLAKESLAFRAGSILGLTLERTIVLSILACARRQDFKPIGQIR